MADTNPVQVVDESHAQIAAAQIALFFPPLLFSLWNAFHYGFRRDAGWIYLVAFCTSVGIAGAAMMIDLKDNSANEESLAPAATILTTIALAPLMGATLSFLSPVAASQFGYSLLAQLLRPLHIVIVVALALGIIGANDSTKLGAGNLGTRDTSATLLRVNSALFLFIWCALALATLFYWALRLELKLAQRVFLKVITIALPFLLVRTIYTGLNAINLDPSSSTGQASQFNPIGGSWVLYLVLGLLMELTVVLLYSGAGMWNIVQSRRAEKRESLSLEHTDAAARASADPSTLEGLRSATATY